MIQCDNPPCARCGSIMAKTTGMVCVGCGFGNELQTLRARVAELETIISGKTFYDAAELERSNIVEWLEKFHNPDRPTNKGEDAADFARRIAAGEHRLAHKQERGSDE